VTNQSSIQDKITCILKAGNSCYYLLTRGDYYTREIKKRIVRAKELFNREISVFTNTLNWFDVIFEALDFMAQRPGHIENWSRRIWNNWKHFTGGEWRKYRPEKVTNEVLKV
jgi:hypothetical protein